MLPRVTSRKLISSVLDSPLGRLTLSGYLRDSVGIPFSRPRLFGNYALVYVLSGGGKYVDPAGERRISAGDMIIVFPDVPHAYGPTDSHWDELHIAFDGALFDLWRARGVLAPARPILRLEPIEYWRPRMESIVVDPGQQGTVPPLTAIGRLTAFLAEAIDAANQEPLRAHDRQWVDKAKSLLDPPNPSPEMSLEEVAEELGLSYVAFRKRFRQLVGMAPGQYHVRRTIDMACLLMYANPHLGNKQLARECGFANEYHFSRRFKQVVGLSPRQFLSQIAPSGGNSNPHVR